MSKKLAELVLVIALAASAQVASASLVGGIGGGLPGNPGGGIIIGPGGGTNPPATNYTTVFNEAGYEAVIEGALGGTGLTGAVYDGVTGNTAQITVNNSYATVTWQKMNIPVGKTLNYNFTSDGQIVVNNVLTGMSRFAGNLTSSGSAGRIIISNPNGILMEGTSVVNANSLILTTHSVSRSGDGSITFNKDASHTQIILGKYYGVSALPGATMTLADDLVVVANGVDMAGADITAGHNISLLTADGATYFAGALSGVSASTVASDIYSPTVAGTTMAPAGAIKIASSSFKTTDGKVYLTANNVNIANSDLSNVEIKAPQVELSEVTVQNDLTASNFDAFLADKITVGGASSFIGQDSIAITNSHFKNVAMKASSIELSEVIADSNLSVLDFVTFDTDRMTLGGDLTVSQGKDVSITNSAISGNSTLSHVHTASTLKSSIGKNSVVNDFNTFEFSDLNVGGSSTFTDGESLALANSKVNLNIGVNKVANWEMIDTTIAGNVSVVGSTKYSGSGNTANGKAYPLNTSETGEAATFVNKLGVGSAPNITITSAAFDSKAFAATPELDYKEYFIRNNVQTIDGVIVTGDSFRAE